MAEYCAKTVRRRTFCQSDIARQTIGQSNHHIELVDITNRAQNLHADLELLEIQRLDKLGDTPLLEKTIHIQRIQYKL